MIDLDENLVRGCMPMVKFVACRYALFIRPPLTREDLVSAGLLGLVEASKRYDPSLGFKFATYARHYVRCYILAEMKHFSNSCGPRFISGDREIGEEGNLWSILTADNSNSDNPETNETIERLNECLEHRSPREQDIIRCYFFDELTLVQIGEIRGVSNERIRQILAVALFRLSKEMKQHCA
jgi:RNA polymerase sigma factor for flagellar operon FliA